MAWDFTLLFGVILWHGTGIPERLPGIHPGGVNGDVSSWWGAGRDVKEMMTQMQRRRGPGWKKG